METRVSCEYCGVEFVKNKPQQRFCSRSCSATFNNTKFSKRRNEQPPCPVCSGKVAYSCTYCSRECRVRAQEIAWELEGGFAYSNSKVIRPYILRKQGGVCAVCSILPEWNGKPLVFVLDHIDGNADNNASSNQRLICPNCDSQTDTYKGKNKGNGRHSRRTRYAEGKSY